MHQSQMAVSSNAWTHQLLVAAVKLKKKQPYCLLNKLRTNSVKILVLARI